MRKNGLFFRFFSAILSAMLVSVLIFTGILMTTLRNERKEAFENEVRLQAREIADSMASLDKLSSVRDNVTMQSIIRAKITDIHDRYNADIWIVSYSSGIVQVLDSSWNTSENIYADSVIEQLRAIECGEEIRVYGLFPELGEHIVTIGVPWTYSDTIVVGAVLLHISIEALEVHVIDVLKPLLPAVLAALVLGTLLSVGLARSLTRPLREIGGAVREFSGGHLDRRIALGPRSSAELNALAEDINRMAEDLSHLENSRRAFVAAVSHELRSPLTSIRGYVEAMMDEVIEPDDYPKYLGVVMAETNRLTDLVRDLLDLSRLESGKFPLEIAPFDFHDMVSRTLESFDGRVAQKHIALTVDVPRPCMVLGDMRRIIQVVSNLVDNALKYLGEGGHLTIAARTVSKDKVRISVSNDGPEIPPEDLPHIFERFYKADKAHTSGGGTGLGLSICRMILQEHGSSIDVASDSRETSFSFALSAAPPQAETSES